MKHRVGKGHRWQLSLYNESTPSLAPVTRELVMDKLGGSIRASFMEDDNIKGGRGVRDEVTKHVHLFFSLLNHVDCEKIVEPSDNLPSRPRRLYSAYLL